MKENAFIRFMRWFPNQYLGILAIAAMMAGLVLSKAVLSIATITLLGNALLNIRVKENLKFYFRDPTCMLLLGVLLIYLISGFYSENIPYWVDRCRMKLPFFALPLGILTLRPISKLMFYRLLLFFFGIILISSIVVFLNYIANFQELNYNISHGQPFPTPQDDHIRFSLEIAFAIIIGGYLVFSKEFILSPVAKWILIAGTIFLLIFIHILAVRSGLVSLYGAGIFFLARWIVMKKKYLMGSLIFLLSVILILIAVSIFPSLKEKIGYIKYEWTLIENGEMKEGHNDAQRILSIEYGMQVGKSHPVLGVGAGDIKDEVAKAYKTDPDLDKVVAKLPHNQFVFVFAATGIVGVIIFISSLFVPLFIKKRKRNSLFVAFLIIIVLSLFSEHTFEIQIGTAFYLLFLLLLIHYTDHTEALTAVENA